jgi:hypothetical protein
MGSSSSEAVTTCLIEELNLITNIAKGRRPDVASDRVRTLVTDYLHDDVSRQLGRQGIPVIGRISTLVLASHIDSWRQGITKVDRLGYAHLTQSPFDIAIPESFREVYAAPLLVARQ